MGGWRSFELHLSRTRIRTDLPNPRREDCRGQLLLNRTDTFLTAELFSLPVFLTVRSKFGDVAAEQGCGADR